MTDDEWAVFGAVLEDKVTDIKIFMNGVEEHFNTHSSVRPGGKPVIHSIKKRVKDISHLREKVSRKNAGGRQINSENLFAEVTDIAGVRLLLLFQNDFSVIDEAVRKRVEGGDWVLKERPKAFTWDPEASEFFGKFDVEVERRETFYTSVHYLIKPRMDSPVCCEIQVRTLFEEIWGEVDHMLNYPISTQNLASKEQLMVLSKIVGAGSRLVDSIQRTVSTV
jgi:ppGpp synthetase/RelA/SpoT-type nucleotidyltranferase